MDEICGWYLYGASESRLEWTREEQVQRHDLLCRLGERLELHVLVVVALATDELVVRSLLRDLSLLDEVAVTTVNTRKDERKV